MTEGVELINWWVDCKIQPTRIQIQIQIQL